MSLAGIACDSSTVFSSDPGQKHAGMTDTRRLREDLEMK
jgi:hypothetical protein